MSRCIAACAAFGLVAGASADPVPDHSPEPPLLAQPMHVRIEALAPGDKGPAGAYRVPDSEVVVSGLQMASRRATPVYGASALEPLAPPQAGPGGMARAILAGQDEEAIKEERAALALFDAEAKLHLHLDSEAQADVAAALAGGSFGGRLVGAPGAGPTLVLRHSIALTVTEMNVYRAHVVLAAQLDDADGHMLWRGLYSASTGGEHHLVGADGWLERDGAALGASVSASLAAVVRVVLADVAQPYPRALEQLKTARLHVPWELARYDVAAYALTDDGRFVALTPRNVDEPVLGGVLLVDKAEVELHAGGRRDRTERVEADVRKLESRTRAGRRAQRRIENRIEAEARSGTSKRAIGPTPVEAQDAVEPTASPTPGLPEPPAPRPSAPATVAELVARLGASEDVRPPPKGEQTAPVPLVAPALAPPVDVSLLTGKTWRFRHPRDPDRFGDVRYAFHGTHLLATNALGSSWGDWRATGDQLCVTFARPGWHDVCYRVVDTGNGRFEMLGVDGRRQPLVFE